MFNICFTAYDATLFHSLKEGVRFKHNDCAWFVTKVSDHQYDL